MNDRREFIKKTVAVLAGAGGLLAPFPPSLFRVLRAEERKIILPRETRRESLAHRNPKDLDTRNLEITPLKDFRTMGTTEHEVDLGKWRLTVAGPVRRPLSLNYEQVRELPSMQKAVLLICPGFFANHGLWKGVEMESLLRLAGAEEGARQVIFRAADGGYDKVERFSLEEVRAGKVFLAYGVNGEPLPEKHGFPLRIVAEEHYGSSWSKYVFRMEIE